MNEQEHGSAAYHGHDGMMQRPYDPVDALLGELLREVLLLAKAVDELRNAVADLRAEIAERKQPTVVAFPGNALKFSR